MPTGLPKIAIATGVSFEILPFNSKKIKNKCYSATLDVVEYGYLFKDYPIIDNGYDIAYILGGTKLKLKQQNLGRIIDSFKNNDKIKIFDVNGRFNEDIPSLIKQGYKIILVILFLL